MNKKSLVVSVNAVLAGIICVPLAFAEGTGSCPEGWTATTHEGHAICICSKSTSGPNYYCLLDGSSPGGFVPSCSAVTSCSTYSPGGGGDGGDIPGGGGDGGGGTGDTPPSDDTGDDDGDEDNSSCGSFSIGALVTAAQEIEIDGITSYLNSGKVVFTSKKDAWVDRGFEDEDTQAELNDAIDIVLDTGSDDDEEESSGLFDDEEPGDDTGDDDEEDDSSELCYSITDVLEDIIDNGCTKAQYKKYTTFFAKVKNGLKGGENNPFVLAELEDEDSLTEEIALLNQAKAKCKKKKKGNKNKK